MKAYKILDLTQVPEEVWLEKRKEGVTSTDVAAICGISPWKCALEVYREKKRAIPREPMNEAMKHGKGLEDYIFSCFVEAHKDDLASYSNPQALYQHPTIPYHMSTPDREIVHKQWGHGLVEIKNVSEYKLDEWQDNPPDYYIMQLQHQLFVTGLEFGYIAALIGGNKYRDYFIPRNDGIIFQMLPLIDHFWNEHILKDIEPEIEGDSASTDYINELFPESEEKSIKLPQCQDDVEKYLEWKEKEDEAKKQKELYSNRIKQLMANSEKAFLPDGTEISWKTVRKKAYTVQESSYRMFKVKQSNAKKVM